MPPVAKSAASAKPAPAKAAPAKAAPAEEAKAPRVKMADLPPAEKQEKLEELVTELYNIEGTDEEAQKAKRGLRAKLRNIDTEWKATCADFIETNWPAPVAQEKPAPAAKAAPAVAVTAKKVSKKA